MITRGRKRTEEEGDPNRKRLRDQAPAKRAKDACKRARRAKSRGPAHQGDASGAVVVTQTKQGELTSRKSHKPVEGKERSADDIEDNTERAKSGQAEFRDGRRQTRKLPENYKSSTGYEDRFSGRTFRLLLY